MEEQDDTTSPIRHGRATLGYVLLLCVVSLWTLSSFLINALFTELSYDKPFLTTYICTASFVLYLIRPGFSHLWRWRNAKVPLFKREDEQDRDGYAPLSRSPSIDRGGVGLDNPSVALDALPPLTIRETSNVALMFCAVWFAANVTINAALAQTSVSSVTVLSSLSGLFTLILGTIFAIEKFNLTRFLAVLASILGVILVSKADNEIVPASSNEAIALLARGADLPDAKLPAHPLFGDLLAILSSLCYAIYTLLLKAKTGDESRISMTLFFGFVGAWNILLFLPLLLILHVTGIEPLEAPPSKQIFLMLLINAGITFVSDMLMMTSMLMTSPLAVTLGLSLTIPLAVVGDLFRGTQVGGVVFFLGAGLVLAGFVAVGWADSQQRDEEDRAASTADPQSRRASFMSARSEQRTIGT